MARKQIRKRCPATGTPADRMEPNSTDPSSPDPSSPDPTGSILVPSSLDGERVDRAISTLTGISRRAAADLVAAAGVKVDGAPVLQRSRRVREGERLEVLDDVLAGLIVAEAPAGDPISASSVEFTVVYEDEHVIVVDKPAYLVVHHGAGHLDGTLVDGLLERFPDLAALADSGVSEPDRPGIVHRLDKGTSGLMVVARSETAVESISEQLRTRRAGREYLALVAGTVEHDDGIIDAPVGRSAKVATRMAVTTRGRPARTSYRVIERIFGPPTCCLIEAKLETGRTHQVRVHMAAIGHPVGGDDRYGELSKTKPLMEGPELERGRLFLHAHRLTIDHPSGDRMSWTSPLPRDLESVLEARRGPNQAAV
jgi:23S rRNA pseudouridine1911/1915/1917 synthase